MPQGISPCCWHRWRAVCFPYSSCVTRLPLTDPGKAVKRISFWDPFTLWITTKPIHAVFGCGWGMCFPSQRSLKSFQGSTLTKGNHISHLSFMFILSKINIICVLLRCCSGNSVCLSDRQFVVMYNTLKGQEFNSIHSSSRSVHVSPSSPIARHWPLRSRYYLLCLRNVVISNVLIHIKHSPAGI